MYENGIGLTEDGLAHLRGKYKLLKQRYKSVAKDLQKNIRDGNHRDPVVQIKGLEQEFLLGDIQKLERLLLGAKIIKKIRNPKYIRNGMRVTYEESGVERTITLVDPLEADPLDGLISFKSPIGQALVGQKRGDVVSAVTPAGIKQLNIKQFY